MNTFQIAALAVAAVAVLSDVRTRRIPNVLTFGAAGAAIAAHAIEGGLAGAATACGGWLVGAAIFFPVFALGGMGAGDIKLLGALGAFLGPASAAWLCLFTGIAGGVMGILVAVGSGYLSRALSNLYGLLMFWRVSGVKPAPELMLETHKGPRLAYAVPVFAGLVASLWLH
jgi:prepilin peptidase CpaA